MKMNYYPQQQYMQPQYRTTPMPQTAPSWTQPVPVVRPVTSIDEVRACPIDFDGSVFYFADMANKRIYTKQINMDGTATINLYELKTDQITNSYVTRQEFEQVINQLKEMIAPPDVQQPAAQQTTYQF